MTESSDVESRRRRLAWIVRNFWILIMIFNLTLVLGTLFLILLFWK